MTTIPEALAALEAATEPSRALSDTVLEAKDWRHVTSGDGPIGWIDPAGNVWVFPPHVAADLQACVDHVVPEDPANPGKPMLWSIEYDEDGVGGPLAYYAGLGKDYHDPEYFYGYSKTHPALALCIASLKAMEGEK